MLAQPRDVDTILDLSFAAGDRIDLSDIDAAHIPGMGAPRARR